MIKGLIANPSPNNKWRHIKGEYLDLDLHKIRSDRFAKYYLVPKTLHNNRIISKLAEEGWENCMDSYLDGRLMLDIKFVTRVVPKTNEEALFLLKKVET